MGIVVGIYSSPAANAKHYTLPGSELAQEARGKIATGLASIAGIFEAHLSMWLESALMEKEHEVLIVAFEKWADPFSTLSAIAKLGQSVFPGDNSLDIWPMCCGNPLLTAVRRLNCCLYKHHETNYGI